MFQDVEAAAVSTRPMVSALLDSIHKHLSDHRRGEVIREGVQVKRIVFFRRLTITVTVKGLQLGMGYVHSRPFFSVRVCMLLPFSNYSNNIHESELPTVAARWEVREMY